MIKVYVKKQSNYPVKATTVKKQLKKFLKKNGIVSDSVVYVSFVGENKMKGLSKKFLDKDKKVHNVLSFTENETKEEFVYPPDGMIRLGEIVICYPEVVREAKEEGKLIDKKVRELLEHGALHLLGRHHQ